MAEREPFPTLIVNEVWARCGGCCECEDGENRTAMTARVDSVASCRCKAGPTSVAGRPSRGTRKARSPAEDCMIVCAPCFAKMRQAGKI